jgi:protein-arginine kinase activator protein McsA
MNFCIHCGKACENAYRIIDVEKNKAIAEYNLCDTCGTTYVQDMFEKPKAEDQHPKLITKSKSKIPKVSPKNKQHVPVNVIATAAELLSLLLDKNVPVTHIKKAHAPCPTCGLTIADLQAKGRFGCPFCYIHFNGMIIDVVDIAQKGAKKHVGKTPKNFTDTQDPGEKLKILKLRLAWAIEHERYEDAAKLKIQVKELESGA